MAAAAYAPGMLFGLIFTVASLVYFIVAGVALRAAFVKGHRGDYTMPISLLFVGIMVALWVASFVLLRQLDLSSLLTPPAR